MRFKSFSLRTLLVMVSVSCVTLGWVVANSNASRNEQRVVDQLELKSGGVAIIDSSTGSLCGTGLTGVARRTPIGVFNRLGAKFSPRIFERVTELDLYDRRYGNDALTIVKQFPDLERLGLRNTSIAPTAIAEFQQSNPRVAVEVSGSKIYDADDPFNSVQGDNPFEAP